MDKLVSTYTEALIRAGVDADTIATLLGDLVCWLRHRKILSQPRAY